jgi:hypothetical protein
LQDNTVRKKYSLVAWHIVCKSKSQRGLNLLDLEIMNIALLAKWTVRFQDPTVSGQWKTILIAKYGKLHSSFKISPFWKAILHDKDLIELGFDKIVRSGKSVLFWKDRWFEGCALFCTYHLLYSIAIKTDITVAEAYTSIFLLMEFKRQLIDYYFHEWQKMLHILGSFSLQPLKNDFFHWRWHNSGLFSVHSFYEWLDFGGVINTEFDVI